MRLRTDYARLCAGFIFVIVVNIQVTLLVQKAVGRTGSGDYHPIYSDLARQFAMRRGNDLKPPSEELNSNLLVDLSEKREQSVALSFVPRKVLTAASETLTDSADSASRVKTMEVNFHTAPQDYLAQTSALPSFAADESEFFVSSIIERSSLGSDLHLTTFILCHALFQKSTVSSHVKKVHPSMKEIWRRASSSFQSTRYHLNGARMQELQSETFRCRIYDTPESLPYTVLGIFMPNRLTADPGANRVLDILRCPMRNSDSVFRKFSNSNASLTVEILKGNNSIFVFHVPWKDRKTGYLMSTSKAASQTNTWKGHTSVLNDQIPHEVDKMDKIDKIDKLHICVPYSDRELTRVEWPMYLEFVSHHLLIGASHITLPVPFAWNSLQMNRLSDIFESYIREGECFLFLSSLTYELIIMHASTPISTGVYSTVQYSTVQYSTVQHSIVLYCIVLYCIVLYCTICTLQFSIALVQQ